MFTQDIIKLVQVSPLAARAAPAPWPHSPPNKSGPDSGNCPDGLWHLGRGANRGGAVGKERARRGEQAPRPPLRGKLGVRAPEAAERLPPALTQPLRARPDLSAGQAALLSSEAAEQRAKEAAGCPWPSKPASQPLSQPARGKRGSRAQRLPQQSQLSKAGQMGEVCLAAPRMCSAFPKGTAGSGTSEEHEGRTGRQIRGRQRLARLLSTSAELEGKADANEAWHSPPASSAAPVPLNWIGGDHLRAGDA